MNEYVYNTRSATEERLWCCGHFVLDPAIHHAAEAWHRNSHRHVQCGPTQFTIADLEIREGEISTREHGFESGQCVAGEPSALSGEKLH